MTKIFNVKRLILMAFIMFSPTLLAHPGHGLHPESFNTVHLLWLVPVMITGGVLTFRHLLANNRKNKLK